MMNGLLPPIVKDLYIASPTCCRSLSLARFKRCDLLVDLEGFHLVAVARRECGLVIDRESCNRCAGCPGCGVTCPRARACGCGGDRCALGPGSLCGSGGTIRCWMCRERACQTVTFLEHSEKVCAPRARLGTRAIRQLHFERATISGLARQ